jgi:acetyl esterase/lipase
MHLRAVVLTLLLGSQLLADEAPKTYEVMALKDINYNGEGADPVYHKLDLYVPKDCKDFPVLFFIHGGAWTVGSKNDLGIYENMGKAFAKQGIGMVSINYRLSPKVKHPAHIEDTAAAFAWVVSNIGKYGGSKEKIFPCGHSAGGHLCALLATDESYLKKHNLDSKAVRGVIPISGVYAIAPGSMKNVWGTDPEVVKQAGALEHVRAGLPPFLIIFADKDLPGCGKAPSERFATALKQKNVSAETMEVPNSDHISLMFQYSKTDDPVFNAIRDFIRKHSEK